MYPTPPAETKTTFQVPAFTSQPRIAIPDRSVVRPISARAVHFAPIENSSPPYHQEISRFPDRFKVKVMLFSHPDTTPKQNPSCDSSPLSTSSATAAAPPLYSHVVVEPTIPLELDESFAYSVDDGPQEERPASAMGFTMEQVDNSREDVNRSPLSSNDSLIPGFQSLGLIQGPRLITSVWFLGDELYCYRWTDMNELPALAVNNRRILRHVNHSEGPLSERTSRYFIRHSDFFAANTFDVTISEREFEFIDSNQISLCRSILHARAIWTYQQLSSRRESKKR